MAQRETYVRPPLVAREAPSQRLATWRYRVITLLLLAALTFLVIWLFLRISGVASEDPGLSGGLSPALSWVAAAR